MQVFSQLRRWSIWLNRVSVMNQARCTPLVYRYIELVYMRVIAYGEAKSISYIYAFIYLVLLDNVFSMPLLLVTYPS